MKHFFKISVAFRVSRDVNPVPAIANFNDLNKDVFLLAAYGNRDGLLLSNVALFLFTILLSVLLLLSFPSFFSSPFKLKRNLL